jgi:calcineurin-like phosphoesterase family protein
MNSALIANWNGVIKKSDLVFILGDFCMRNPDRFISPLNGTKIFLCGNHDKRWELSALLVISDGIHIFMQHSPYLKEVPQGTELILCGHVHDKWKSKMWKDTLMVNVGVDVWDYKPVSLETIKSISNPKG